MWLRSSGRDVPVCENETREWLRQARCPVDQSLQAWKRDGLSITDRKKSSNLQNRNLLKFTIYEENSKYKKKLIWTQRKGQEQPMEHEQKPVVCALHEGVRWGAARVRGRGRLQSGEPTLPTMHECTWQGQWGHYSDQHGEIWKAWFQGEGRKLGLPSWTISVRDMKIYSKNRKEVEGICESH